MTRRVWWAKATAALATAVGLACVAGCGDRPVGDGRPVIVTSIYPLTSLVEQMVGSQIEVVTLMPPGENPHNFDPTPNQLARLARSQLAVAVGLGLDPWAERAAHNAGVTKRNALLTFADLIGLDAASAGACDHMHDHDHHDHHHHDHDGPNNHLWLDLGQTIRFVEALAPQLVERFPEQAHVIERNAAALVEELAALDNAFRRQFEAVPVKHLVTFHNAFDPLAERYGLTVVAHLTDVEMTPGGEVTSGALQQAIAAIREHDLKAIYAEPQFPRAAVQRLRKSTGVQVLILDPEGNPAVEGYRTYQQMMRTNVATLVRGQSLTP